MSNATQSTLLIQVDTQEYPLSLEMIRKRTGVSFGAEPPLEDLEALGFAEVVLVGQIPEADVVTEGPPALEDGVWHRTWRTRAFNADELSTRLSELKTSASAAVMALRRKDLEKGFAWTVEGFEPFHVQLRVEDRINLLTLNLQGQQMVAAASESTVPFRGYENFTVRMTGQQLIDMTQAALVAMGDVYELSWELKDDIERATTVAELPELPETLIS